MKKLLKDYECSQSEEYYDICFNSYINGQRTQAKEQFLMMNRKERKDCYVYFTGFYDDPQGTRKEILNFFFYLI